MNGDWQRSGSGQGRYAESEERRRQSKDSRTRKREAQAEKQEILNGKLKMLARAESEMLGQLGTILSKKDLTFSDIPLDLLVRRLLFCAFSDTSSTSQTSIKTMLASLGSEIVAKERDDETQVGDLLDEVTGGGTEEY